MTSQLDKWMARSAAIVIMSLVACGEKIGEDPFLTLSDSGSGSGGEETGGSTMTTSATSDGTSASTSASTTASSSATTAETGGSESGVVECTCISEIPDGWFGPVALTFGPLTGEAPECGGAYTETSLTLLSGYHDPGPAECSCECELQASFCQTYMYEHNSNACGTYNPFLQPSDTCMAHSFTQGWANVYMYQQGNPYCQAMVTETIPEVEWDTLVTSCGLEDPMTCDNGDVCIPSTPDGFDGAPCIFQEGEVACPPGDFDIQKVFHTGVEDDRDCTNCACGQGQGTCMGSVDVFATDDCSGAAVASVPAGNQTYGPCTATGGGQSAQLNFTGSGSCPIMTQPMPEGGVAPVGPFTYCCMG